MTSVPPPRPTVLLHGDQIDGQFSVTEITLPANSGGPPLHTHDFDEAYFVLEGELLFQVEDTVVRKSAGELSFAPRNVAHTLANWSKAPARYILFCAPAGFERHWARVAAEATGAQLPDWADQPLPRVTVVGSPIWSCRAFGDW